MQMIIMVGEIFYMVDYYGGWKSSTHYYFSHNGYFTIGFFPNCRLLLELERLDLVVASPYSILFLGPNFLWMVQTYLPTHTHTHLRSAKQT